MPIKHLKVSLKTDAADSSLVRASDWNATHDLTGLVASDITDFSSAVSAAVGYPVTLAKGGTNATTAAAARVNLGLDAATGERIAPDGTMTLPGMAFASEPGLGFYRNGAGKIGVAASGIVVEYLDASTPATLTKYLWPRAAGNSQIWLSNAANGVANVNVLKIEQQAGGNGSIATVAGGTSTRGNLTLDAPQILHNDGTVAAPNISFASEPGMGLYRKAAGTIGFAQGGVQVAGVAVIDPTTTYFQVGPKTPGLSGLYARSDSVGSSGPINQVGLTASPTGYIIGEGLANGATAKPMVMDFPGGLTYRGPTFTIGNNLGAQTLKLSGGPPGASQRDIFSYQNTLPRWLLRLGDGDAADMFRIYRYDDPGTTATNCFSIDRLNGNVGVPAILKVGYGMAMYDSDNANYPKLVFNGAQRWQLNVSAALLSWYNNGGTSIFEFDNNGNASKLGSGNTWSNISDARAKENVREWTTGLDEVLALHPVIYDRADTGEKDAIGLLADEAELVIPEMVKRGPGEIGGVMYEDRAIMTIDPMFYALVNSIKTLHARIAELEARLEAAGP